MLGENKRLFLATASRQLQLAEKNNRMRFFGSPRTEVRYVFSQLATEVRRRRRRSSCSLTVVRPPEGSIFPCP